MATTAKLVSISKKAPLDSPLTPALKDFIDRAIVPALVKQALAAIESADGPIDSRELPVVAKARNVI